jgi:hypothetical protein
VNQLERWYTAYSTRLYLPIVRDDPARIPNIHGSGNTPLEVAIDFVFADTDAEDY